MTQQHQINGVDVTRFFETIDTLQKEPGLAKFRFRVRNRWLTGGHNRSTVNGYYGAGQEHTDRKATFVLENDAPGAMLGQDRGPSPVEHMLHGLAGCLTTTLVYWATASGVRIDEIESRVEGELDLRGFLGLEKSVRNGCERIRIHLKVRGDATEQELAELIEVAQKRAIVLDTIAHGVGVTFEIEESIAA
jgi:uncharacterized OsmC-like protein